MHGSRQEALNLARDAAAARAQAERIADALRESEERLRNALEAGHVFTFEWDPSTDRVLRSPNCGPILGWTSDATHDTGQAFFARIHPEDRDAFVQLMTSLSPDRQEYQTQYRYLRPDNGREVLLEESGSAVFDETGKLIRLRGLTRDITERKRAEDALQQSERQYRRLHETMLQGVVYQDAGGRIISMNPAAERILGKTPVKFLGGSSEGEQHYTIKEDGSPFPGWEHPAMVALRAGQELHNVVMGVFNPREQGYRWISISAVPLFHQGETRPYQVYTLFDDITERKRAEAKMAADLASLTRMHALSWRAVEAAGIEPLLQETMDTATAIVQADKGTLQLLEGETLRIVAHHGHEQTFLDFFAAAENVASVCGEATRRGERVVVPDVETSPLFANTASLPVLRAAGVRAVQSTPLTTRGGRLLGILTTQWATPHTPDEHDLWRLDLLVRQVSDLIEQKQSEEALRQGGERLRFALETIHTGAWELDLVDHTAHRSLEHDRLFGYDHLLPQWTYEMFLEHVLPEDRRAVDEQFRHVMDTGGDWNFECRIRRADGPTRWIWAAGRPIMEADGSARRMAGIVQDITARKRAEEALLKRSERLELLSEAAAHLLAAEDPTLMVRDLFEKVCRHLDVHAYFNFMVNEQGDALRLDSFAGIPERSARLLERLEFGQAVCGTVAQTRQPMHVLDVQRSTDEKVKLIKRYGIRAYCCHPLMAGERLLGTLSFGSRGKDRFDEDEVEFMRAVCHYVAMAEERLRLEQDLRGRIAQLAEADRRKDEFLAMLAHELRNPISPVRSAVEIMRLVGAKNPILTRQRDIIDRQTTHMARLLEDLLDVSRVTRGKIELKKQPLHLEDVLVHAVETARPLIESRHHELTIALPSDPLRIEADPDRLAQAIGNLLTNAAKYTGEGGRIWLESGREGGGAVIRVSDTGAGIAPEMLPRIFDLFAQADQSLARTQGGLGIGLTMVKKLVELHGGTVEARSVGLGLGSEFTIRLPALPGEAEEPVKPDGPRERLPEVPPRRILVVDDIVDSADSLTEMLALEGHETRAAYSGPSALTILCEFAPEVVLLDIGMPGMDGYEVARRIRQESADQPPLLVALTGYVQESDRQAACEAGFDRHLEKPVDLPALRELLSQPPAGGRAPASTP